MRGARTVGRPNLAKHLPWRAVEPDAGMANILQTPRLQLRELSHDDLDVASAMLTHPEVMRFWPRPYRRDEVLGWLGRALERYAQRGFGHWAAVERASGTAVGLIGLIAQRLDGAEEIEVAYIVGRPYWNRGFATEAALACRDHAIKTLGHPRVISLIRPENEPSRAVARKIGLTTEGRLVPHGGFDHLVYTS